MQAGQERQKRERQERERWMREQKERALKERQAREKQEKEKQERERQEQDKQAREKQERERQEREKQAKASLFSDLSARKDRFTGKGFPLVFSSSTSFVHFPSSLSAEMLIKCPMCSQSFTNPRTLDCLHTFCLACLETQKPVAPSSDLRCHQCRAPFALPLHGGLNCNTFVDSMVKFSKVFEGDANSVVKCETCDDEDATMHCVNCNENIGPTCSSSHRRSKATANHQQVPLEEALAGNVTMKRIHYCQEHFRVEVNKYCKTCSDAVCAMCGIEKHPMHDICSLDQMTAPLQDQIAGYTITITKREEEAKKAITNLVGTMNKIEEHRGTAEKEIATIFASIRAAVDAREAKIIGEMQDKRDELRKTTVKEKEEAELATFEFRGFHAFAEGLLAQSTPYEIAGTHKMARS